VWPRTPSIAKDANGQFTFYCRQCGRIKKSAEWPDHCASCGNTLDYEGFGVSGDNAVSNTTVGNKIGTIDKKIG